MQPIMHSMAEQGQLYGRRTIVDQAADQQDGAAIQGKHTHTCISFLISRSLFRQLSLIKRAQEPGTSSFTAQRTSKGLDGQVVIMLVPACWSNRGVQDVSVVDVRVAKMMRVLKKKKEKEEKLQL